MGLNGSRGRDRHQSRRKKGGPSSEPRGPPGARAREEVEEAAKETEEDQPVREKQELQGAFPTRHVPVQQGFQDGGST